MQALLERRELVEALVEDRDQLKAEERLDAGQHHAALGEDVVHHLGERESLAVSVALHVD